MSGKKTAARTPNGSEEDTESLTVFGLSPTASTNIINDNDRKVKKNALLVSI